MVFLCVIADDVNKCWIKDLDLIISLFRCLVRVNKIGSQIRHPLLYHVIRLITDFVRVGYN